MLQTRFRRCSYEFDPVDLPIEICQLTVYVGILRRSAETFDIKYNT
uniref:Uncharacterized protein n=1 Tax=Medicago truncatula TaxID=3880 RepID=A2Q3T2_MEDTR|nr:hypothetical protein MtrDRAFT_AC155889g8v2 [Medicago truncatula]